LAVGDYPSLTVGSCWPYATTVWDYNAMTASWQMVDSLSHPGSHWKRQQGGTRRRTYDGDRCRREI